MADMKRTEQISVAQLIERLKRFEKDYPDVNVTCCIPDGTICYAVSIDQGCGRLRRLALGEYSLWHNMPVLFHDWPTGAPLR